MVREQVQTYCPSERVRVRMGVDVKVRVEVKVR